MGTQTVTLMGNHLLVGLSDGALELGIVAVAGFPHDEEVYRSEASTVGLPLGWPHGREVSGKQ